MGVTEDRNDPDLTYGIDKEPRPQAEKYIVMEEAKRLQGVLPGASQPVRRAYYHVGPNGCGQKTTMAQAIAETYAKDPTFYGATYCAHCGMHRPVGPDGEFVWADPSGLMLQQKVGTFE